MGLLLIISRLFDLNLGKAARAPAATVIAQTHQPLARGKNQLSPADIPIVFIAIGRANRRFLLLDAACNCCRCKYVHLDDRRTGGDIVIDLGDLGAFLPPDRTPPWWIFPPAAAGGRSTVSGRRITNRTEIKAPVPARHSLRRSGWRRARAS